MCEVGIDPCRDKSEDGKQDERPNCYRHVSPVLAKGPRKIAKEKISNYADAFAFGAIDLAVCAYDEAVEIIDELGIASLGTRDREVGGSSTIELTELADLHPREPFERSPAQKAEKVLKPSPVIFSFVDKSVHIAFGF